MNKRVSEGKICVPDDRREDEELGDWRGKLLSRPRTLIRQADPEVAEEWTWSVSGVVSRRIDLYR